MDRNPNAPNIVLIHGHDLGRHLACYGRPVETPHIDDLAAGGQRFDNYFAPAPQCSPSRASMMTGLYPSRNGMMGLAHLRWQLQRPDLALPSLLRRGGYRTLLFGEQHEAQEPSTLGYDASYVTGWPQLARNVAAEFARVLPTISTREPFFASIGFFEAHRPFDHPGYGDEDPGRVEVPPYLPDEPDVRADLAALASRIRAVDDGVGTVLRALETARVSEDTLVIFTTDHGLAFPRAKGTLYDTGLEAAFVLRWPDVLSAGQVRKELTCNVDLAPTLLDIARLDSPPNLDGVSFLPLLQGETHSVRDEFICQLTWHDRYAPMRGIRSQRWKYIRTFEDRERLYLPADVEESPSGRAFRRHERAGMRPREELYDLLNDPFELNDLAGDEEFTPIKDEFSTRLREWMKSSGDPLPDRHPEWLAQAGV